MRFLNYLLIIRFCWKFVNFFYEIKRFLWRLYCITPVYRLNFLLFMTFSTSSNYGNAFGISDLYSWARYYWRNWSFTRFDVEQHSIHINVSGVQHLRNKDVLLVKVQCSLVLWISLWNPENSSSNHDQAFSIMLFMVNFLLRISSSCDDMLLWLLPFTRLFLMIARTQFL